MPFLQPRKCRNDGNLGQTSRLIILNSIICCRNGLLIKLIVSEKSVFSVLLKLALNKYKTRINPFKTPQTKTMGFTKVCSKS